MRLYCKCTETEPDFVGALLRAPIRAAFSDGATVSMWLCHDCFEQHVCNQYMIDVCTDEDDPIIGYIRADGDDE